VLPKFVLPSKILSAEQVSRHCLMKLGVVCHKVESDISRWVDEDQGSGDVSLWNLVPPGVQDDHAAHCFVVAKEDFYLSGVWLMAAVFHWVLDGNAEVRTDFSDGDGVKAGDVIMSVKGAGAGLLAAERVALNLASRLSGITTYTRKVFRTLESLKGESPEVKTAVLLETRKTTPGLRMYEKYATRVGGARNHRHGLDSGVMFKENHLRLGGEMKSMIGRATRQTPVLTKVEVEVTNLEEFLLAAESGADLIMLDNFDSLDVKKAVALRDQRFKGLLLEVSGNLDQKNLAELAISGVDFASMGALIHKASWVDMSLQMGSPL
jgi:nicotinate-nucleotide pyrophosphorylase (carboxylating)